MPLLVGTDGVQKMSQSLGNYVGITEGPDDMFGKLVRVPDELIAEYRRLTLDFFADPAEADRVADGLSTGALNPWGEKRRMAREVVDLYHGAGAGAAAEARFETIHRDRDVPDDVEERPIPEETVRDGRVWLPRLLADLGLADSNSAGQRLIEQGGVRLDGEVVADPRSERALAELRGAILQVSRRRFVRLT
jgi:tyrosyl-tRNA synthetase